MGIGSYIKAMNLDLEAVPQADIVTFAASKACMGCTLQQLLWLKSHPQITAFFEDPRLGVATQFTYD